MYFSLTIIWQKVHKHIDDKQRFEGMQLAKTNKSILAILANWFRGNRVQSLLMAAIILWWWLATSHKSLPQPMQNWPLFHIIIIQISQYVTILIKSPQGVSPCHPYQMQTSEPINQTPGIRIPGSNKRIQQTHYVLKTIWLDQRCFNI